MYPLLATFRNLATPFLLASAKKKSSPNPKPHIRRLELRGVKVGISKIGVLILVEFAVAIRLEVRWRHGGRKAASVRKAVKCALRFGRRNFGGSKEVGMAIILFPFPKHEERRAALTNISKCSNVTWKP